jgi:low affinity Fe/Cu permease
MKVAQLFTRFANVVSKVTGRPMTFILCMGIVVLWAVSGPIFKFSDTWQLVINTGTTIITFLMVFLIQNTQNRDAAAMQAKLDAIIDALPAADERFIGIEHLTDRELELVVEECERRAGEAARQNPGLPGSPTRSKTTRGKTTRRSPAKTSAKRL